MSNSSLGPLPDWARPVPGAPSSKGDAPSGTERRGLLDKLGRSRRKGDEEPSEPAERPSSRRKERATPTESAQVPVPTVAPSAPPAAAPTAPPAQPQPAAEPTLPPVEFVVDPNAPVHEVHGRRIALEWFSTKYVELYENGMVRLTGPLVASPPFEQLVSIDYWCDDTPRSTKEKLLGRVGSSNLRELGIAEPLREAVLTITTADRTHSLREEDRTESGAQAAATLIAATYYIAEQMQARMPKPAPAPEPVVEAVAPVADASATVGELWARAAEDAAAATADPQSMTPPEPMAVSPEPSAFVAPSESSHTAPFAEPTSVAAEPAPSFQLPPVEMPRVELPRLDLSMPLPPAPPLLDPPSVSGGEPSDPSRFGLLPVAPLLGGREEVRSPADRLRDLAALHKEGLVSDEEFERKRQQLLDNL